jgi:ESX-1-secreted protein regulator
MKQEVKIMRRSTRRIRDAGSRGLDAAQLPEQSLAAKVNWLFEHVANPATGKAFTLYAIRDRLRERDINVSCNTIRNLRIGAVTHPSWHVVEGLASVFQVPLSFFSADLSISELEQQFAALTLLKRSPYWTLAQRVSTLSPAGIAAVLAITEVALQQIQTLETGS